MRYLSGPGYRAEIVDVTPELAEKWLAANTGNRKVRHRMVNTYASDMEQDLWRDDNGAPIRIARDGTILDGQHRLLAIVKSGRTQRMLVLFDMSPAAREVTDTGAKRTLADALVFRGEQRTVTLAATLKRVALWKAGFRKFNGNPHHVPSNSQLLRLLDDHPEVRTSVEVADWVHSYVKIPASALGLCHWVFSHVDVDPEEEDQLQEDVEFFFARLKDGANLPEYHPISTLRRTAMQYMVDTKNRVRSDIMVALIVKAWNAFRDGRDGSTPDRYVQQLRFRTGGAKPEVFPEPR